MSKVSAFSVNAIFYSRFSPDHFVVIQICFLPHGSGYAYYTFLMSSSQYFHSKYSCFTCVLSMYKYIFIYILHVHYVCNKWTDVPNVRFYCLLYNIILIQINHTLHPFFSMYIYTFYIRMWLINITLRLWGKKRMSQMDAFLLVLYTHTHDENVCVWLHLHNCHPDDDVTMGYQIAWVVPWRHVCIRTRLCITCMTCENVYWALV